MHFILGHCGKVNFNQTQETFSFPKDRQTTLQFRPFSTAAAARKPFFFFCSHFLSFRFKKNLCAAASPIARIKSDPSRNALVLLPPVAVYDFFFFCGARRGRE